jgi:hypothetical protein
MLSQPKFCRCGQSNHSEPGLPKKREAVAQTDQRQNLSWFSVVKGAASGDKMIFEQRFVA